MYFYVTFIFRYNYIAKQENLNEEMIAFLNSLNPVFELAHVHQGNLTESVVERYLNTIGNWNIKALARKYIYDFELFNYPLSKYLVPKPQDNL